MGLILLGMAIDFLWIAPSLNLFIDHHTPWLVEVDLMLYLNHLRIFLVHYFGSSVVAWTARDPSYVPHDYRAYCRAMDGAENKRNSRGNSLRENFCSVNG